MYRIRLFGGLSLEGPAGPVTGRAVQRRRLALLALLAAEHPRPLSRDKLIGYLWPEHDTDRARHLLRDSLYLLRAALGEDALLSDGDEIQLNGARFDSDLQDFTDSLERGDPESAVAHYAGPFLDGVFLDDADEFERWAALERVRLASRMAEALEAAAETRDSAGDARGAARWWGRLAAHDPGNGRVALRLMQALAASGDRAGALRHARDHAAFMEAEFGAGPDTAVVTLAEALRRDVEPLAAPAATNERTISDPPAEPPTTASGTQSAPIQPLLSPSHTEPGIRDARPRRGLEMVGGAILLVLLLAGVFNLRATPTGAFDPARVIVIPFENRTADPALDAIGEITADWITQGLATTGEVQVVSARTARVASRHVLAAPFPAGARGVARAVAEETGSGIVVTGAYHREGGVLRIQAQITDVISGRVIAAPEPADADPHSPIAGITALRERVMAELATWLNPRLRSHVAVTTPPPTYEAYRAYAEATERLIDSDWRGALEPLRRAAAIDPGYSLPLVALANAHFNLGEYAAADSAARLARRSRDRLAPLDQAWLDIIHAWLEHDHAAAYRAARTAAMLAPGSTWSAQLAVEARRLNRPGEAVRIYSSLDPTRGELRGYPWYWFDLGLARHQLGQHRRELRDVRRGRALMPDHPIVRLAEVRALAALGRTRELDAVVDEVLTRTRSEDPDAGTVMGLASRELRAHGHEEAARRMAERAVAWYEARPDLERTGPHALPHARALQGAGRWGEARAIVSQLAAGDPDRIEILGTLGAIAAREGDRDLAERSAARLDELGQRPYTWGGGAYWRACIAAELGQADRAVEQLRDAVGRGRLRDGFHTDLHLEPLRVHPGFRALVRPQG